MSRKPGQCPEGHTDCDINGLYIHCRICGWIDDSTLEDFMVSEGFVACSLKKEPKS